jgi:hypothetical protein
VTISSVGLGPQNYSFNSVVNPLFPITVQYILEFSPSATFPSSQTYRAGTLVSPAQGQLFIPATLFPQSSSSSSAPSYIQNASSLWWRVGARNVIDSPGPLPDQFTRERYIFSTAQTFTSPIAPPAASKTRGHRKKG